MRMNMSFKDASARKGQTKGSGRDHSYMEETLIVDPREKTEERVQAEAWLAD